MCAQLLIRKGAELERKSEGQDIFRALRPQDIPRQCDSRGREGEGELNY